MPLGGGFPVSLGSSFGCCIVLRNRMASGNGDPPWCIPMYFECDQFHVGAIHTQAPVNRQASESNAL